MEPVIKEFLLDEGSWIDLEATASRSVLHRFVRDRHLKNKHKHEAPPNLKLRDLCD